MGLTVLPAAVQVSSADWKRATWVAGEFAAMNAAEKEFGGEEPQFDDVTMLCVEFKGAGRPA